jgi:hypothetical protein
MNKLIALFVIGCSVVFGQSKQDIADLKEEFPKNKENVTSHVNAYFGGFREVKLSKKTPIVVTHRNYKHEELSRMGRLYPYCLDKSIGSLSDKEDQQKYYDEIVSQLPKSITKDMTGYLERGSSVNGWFVIIEGVDDLEDLSFRTNPSMKEAIHPTMKEKIPLRFKGLFQKTFDGEIKKIDKIVKKAISENDGYCFVSSFQNGYRVYGWVKLSDLVKQKVVGKKKEY